MKNKSITNKIIYYEFDFKAPLGGECKKLNEQARGTRVYCIFVLEIIDKTPKFVKTSLIKVLHSADNGHKGVASLGVSGTTLQCTILPCKWNM